MTRRISKIKSTPICATGSSVTHLPLDIESLLINVIDGYVGPGYAQANSAVFETIKYVARSEGLVLDPVYTGKAFHALLSEIKRGRFDDSNDIVFVHTGGVFGVFPQREQFNFSA